MVLAFEWKVYEKIKKEVKVKKPKSKWLRTKSKERIKGWKGNGGSAIESNIRNAIQDFHTNEPSQKVSGKLFMP